MAIVSKIPVTVQSIIKHTPTVVSYTFEPQKRLPRFRPGQFLHLALDEYDPTCEWPESRVFSIANAPSEQNVIRLVISGKGAFTTRIVENLHVGDEVWLKLPYGDFTFENSDPNIVMIAGGTGIAPFISYLDDTTVQKSGKQISLYYGVQNPSQLMFQDNIEKYKSAFEGFHFSFFVEKESNTSPISCTEGILDIDAIFAENRDKKECSYYLSGPIGMIRSFREALLEKGVAMDKIIIDSWE